MKQERMTKFNKIFPWYDGLSGDLLFWVAIDTLFLTVVKNFNASQIVSLTTVSLITCIALQVLLTTMELSRKIGRAIMSLSFTMILVDNPMITVITILFILSIIEILISINFSRWCRIR